MLYTEFSVDWWKLINKVASNFEHEKVQVGDKNVSTFSEIAISGRK